MASLAPAPGVRSTHTTTSNSRNSSSSSLLGPPHQSTLVASASRRPAAAREVPARSTAGLALHPAASSRPLRQQYEPWYLLPSRSCSRSRHRFSLKQGLQDALCPKHGALGKAR
jgi:hypothetical protein